MHFNKLLILLFATLTLITSSQTAKLEIGDCLIDSREPAYFHLIDSDESGIYFLKKAEKADKAFFYVDKYDANSLKLVYSCAINTPYEDNLISDWRPIEREYHTILKNGMIDFLFISLEGKEYKVFGTRINKEGKCGPVSNLYTRTYNKKVSFRFSRSLISMNKEFLVFYKHGEAKNMMDITCLKITSDTKLEAKELYNYQLIKDKNTSLDALKNVYNDGRIGSFYNYNDKDWVAMLSPSKKFFQKEMKEFIKDKELVYDVNGYTYNNLNCNLKNDTNMIVAVYNKKPKLYGFLNMNYSAKSGEVYQGELEYMNETNAGKANDGTRVFHELGQASFIYNQTVFTNKITYKIISHVYQKVGNMVADGQSYLTVLSYDAKGKNIGQKLVPFHFMHQPYDKDFSNPFGKLSQNNNTNYSACKKGDNLYVFMLEDKDNKGLDPEKASMGNYNKGREAESCYLACYWVNANEPLKRIAINNPKNYTLLPIINNFKQPEGYQYIMAEISGRKTLAKVIVE